ncbi:hypothetical protein DRP43_04615 [candidate division TA06 bacterium]|uniref:MetS family NSS transporter small subunit n=1 Tax=candidate division TA06 bacterium TaxID=2250710 RepID=A0A660SGJ0_UNCT6|nr:MAG: hypothetical protein DRP43_04615 [candidate division TA06 bacterium]
MPASAIIMLIFGCVVLYGGLAVCLHRAAKSGKESKNLKKGKEEKTL